MKRAALPRKKASSVPTTDPAGNPDVRPSLDAATTRRLIEALPEDAFQLIIREAYLFRAGQIIFNAMQEAKARQGTVSTSRPPFLLLRKSETREAFNAALETANADLALYEKAAARNADAMRRLRKCAERHIEFWLRENDETYYSGLVSESLVADWRRGVTRLETGVRDFIVALGCARNSLVGSSVNASGVRQVSETSRKAILEAAHLGDIVAREVMAMNGLASARDRHLDGTAFASAFPRLPDFDFGASLEEASILPVSFLQQQFATILERCQELCTTGLPALLESVRQAESQHTAVKGSYLLGVWQSLREFALAHYVDEADLNEVARATEQMFEQGRFVEAAAGG